MKLPKPIWDQIKNITVVELMIALKKDGWELDNSHRGVYIYYKYMNGDKRRITVHYHPKKTYGCKLLKNLLRDIGWGIEDLRRLKLIKK
jgi:predicted RNA binding protein YcfA (HicA-like mRNA interferase family)